MTAAARRETAADDSGPIEAPKRRASDGAPAPWSIAQVGALMGMIGFISGGIGSFGAQSFARGVDAKRLESVEAAVHEHGATLRDHAALVGSFSTRMAIVEVNVVAVKDGVARIEQAMRDERAERRSGGGK